MRRIRSIALGVSGTPSGVVERERKEVVKVQKMHEHSFVLRVLMLISMRRFPHTATVPPLGDDVDQRATGGSKKNLPQLFRLEQAKKSLPVEAVPRGGDRNRPKLRNKTVSSAFEPKNVLTRAIESN